MKKWEWLVIIGALSLLIGIFLWVMAWQIIENLEYMVTLGRLEVITRIGVYMVMGSFLIGLGLGFLFSADTVRKLEEEEKS